MQQNPIMSSNFQSSTLESLSPSGLQSQSGSQAIISSHRDTLFYDHLVNLADKKSHFHIHNLQKISGLS